MKTQSQVDNTWWALATQWMVVRRSITFAIFVGAVLITINHGDAVFRGDLTHLRLIKMALTVIFPYLVSTFSSVSAMKNMSDSIKSERDKKG